MPVAPHIATLREKIGHDLLLVPCVAVLPRDEDGRVLLVRQADFGRWGTVGGAVDVDEAPDDAARREAREEIGAEVELTGLLGALGGPQFRLTYPNGDECACVSIVYGARVIGDVLTPDGDEVTEARWFHLDELAAEPELGAFAAETFRSLGLMT
ncbi:NUDIX hydrolase [soil metagenome]